jgi:glycosyltransferase involved in cell wall biosynthesis
MTVYNCEKFIAKSLQSIFNQTFTDFELIIYNDASVDTTGKIINELLEQFDGNYFNETGESNRGCVYGRNKAIEKARGEYIAIQDGDDISDSKRLLTEIEFMETNSSIFCVGSWANLIDEDDKKIGVFEYSPIEHNKIIEEIYRMRNPIVDPSVVFKRNIFNQLGGYSEEWNLIPDLHLWVKAMMKNYFFASIPHKLVSYRRHEESLMAKYSRRALQQHRLLYDTVIKKHKKEGFLL